MQRSLRFILTTTWVIASRGYDAYATFQHTPDLRMEANPLVSVFGLGWSPLLIIVGSLTLYAVIAYYMSVFRPMDLLPTGPGFNFRETATYLYLGRKESWLAMIYKLPNSWKRFHYYMGIGLTKCLVFAGIVSTLMWIGIRHTSWYPPLHSATFIYVVLIVGSVSIGLIWSRNMYRRYQLRYQTT